MEIKQLHGCCGVGVLRGLPAKNTRASTMFKRFISLATGDIAPRYAMYVLTDNAPTTLLESFSKFIVKNKLGAYGFSDTVVNPNTSNDIKLMWWIPNFTNIATYCAEHDIDFSVDVEQEWTL